MADGRLRACRPRPDHAACALSLVHMCCASIASARLIRPFSDHRADFCTKVVRLCSLHMTSGFHRWYRVFKRSHIPPGGVSPGIHPLELAEKLAQPANRQFPDDPAMQRVRLAQWPVAFFFFRDAFVFCVLFYVLFNVLLGVLFYVLLGAHFCVFFGWYFGSRSSVRFGVRFGSPFAIAFP